MLGFKWGITGAALILPHFVGQDGVLFAEILAWLGADFILVPTFIYCFKKLNKLKAVEKITD